MGQALADVEECVRGGVTMYGGKGQGVSVLVGEGTEKWESSRRGVCMV